MLGFELAVRVCTASSRVSVKARSWARRPLALGDVDVDADDAAGAALRVVEDDAAGSRSTAARRHSAARSGTRHSTWAPAPKACSVLSPSRIWSSRIDAGPPGRNGRRSRRRGRTGAVARRERTVAGLDVPRRRRGGRPPAPVRAVRRCRRARLRTSRHLSAAQQRLASAIAWSLPNAVLRGR